MCELSLKKTAVCEDL